MFSITGTSLIGLRKDQAGLWIDVLALTDGMTLDTGASLYAIGCLVRNTANGKIFENVGTVAVPVWLEQIGAGNVQVATVNLAAADLIDTAAGKLSHANGLIVVPAAPAGYVNILHRAIVSYTFGVAAYTGGGNTTFNIGAGGAALTGLIATTTLWQNASSIIQEFVPLSTVAFPITTATSINLKTASAITNPGTATGTAKVYAWYSTVAI